MSARVERFTALLASQPGNPLFRFSLAQALLEAGETAASLPHLVQCADGKSDWMMPRIMLGRALLDLGRRDEARAWLEAALALAVDQHHVDPAGELRELLAGL